MFCCSLNFNQSTTSCNDKIRIGPCMRIFAIIQIQHWLTINNDCLWYVSGKNTATLSIDADFIDNLMVRCRIGIADGTSTAAPDLPNEATACIAWRYPKVIPTVFSYGGDRVFAENSFMTFGLIVHVAKHDDMTLEQKRH